MSERENPDDPQTAANSAWSQSSASNRPADGAARADSLQGVEGGWTASDGATDFLGLDADGSGAGASEPSSASARPESAGTAQDWLFHMEHAPAVEVQAATSVGELEPPASSPFDAEETAETGSFTLDPAGSDAAAEDGSRSDTVDALLDEVLPETPEGDPLALASADESRAASTPPERAPRLRRVQWMVAAGLLLTLGGAVGWHLWLRGKPLAPEGPATTLVAQSPTTAKKPVPAGASAPTRSTRPSTPVPPGPPPVEEAQPESGTLAQTPDAPANPSEEPTAAAGEPASSGVVAEAPPIEPRPLPAESSAAGGSAPLGFSPNGLGARPTAVALPPVVTPKGARRPERAELGNTWGSNTVPFDAIAGERVLVTPRVGAVRVLLKNGEHLQGHLHSVGQGHLSVDIALGRMTIDYRDVSELAQIQEADLTKKPTGGLPEETAGLPYVCARVPNGTITGWLVSQDKGKLTLITETAKKLTIDDAGFEPVSMGRARILGALAKNASSPK